MSPPWVRVLGVIRNAGVLSGHVHICISRILVVFLGDPADCALWDPHCDIHPPSEARRGRYTTETRRGGLCRHGPHAWWVHVGYASAHLGAFLSLLINEGVEGLIVIFVFSVGILLYL